MSMTDNVTLEGKGGSGGEELVKMKLEDAKTSFEKVNGWFGAR